MKKSDIMQVIQSPKDNRDYTIAMATDISDNIIPDRFEVWQPPVESQGKTGNCVAQALANIMECINHKNGLTHQDMSVGYIYGSSILDSPGMIPREACASLVKDGDIYRDAWEYLGENPECRLLKESLSQDIKSSAKKVKMYVRINSEEEMKRFMLKYNLPVLITANVEELYGEWYGKGSHAIVCRGWIPDKEGWGKGAKGGIHFTNSWGTGGWLGDGTGYTKFSILTEVWGVIPMDEIKFKDVNEARWSAKAIQEAANDGIVVGFEDGTFRPSEPLTREQMAAIWQRMKKSVQNMIESEK